MTTVEKVALAEEVVSSYPLSEVLQALELPRSTGYYQSTVRVEYAERYSELRPVLEQIAREHPEYGYRRTTTELRETYDRVVNEKVVRQLHRLWGLPLVRSTHPPRPSGVRTVITEAGDRANLVALLSEIRPLEVLYTDFTELRYAAGRYKAQLIAFPDHASKVVLGWSVGERAVTELALDGWKRAVGFLAELGVSPEGIIVHHDRDSVFTSYDWMGQLLLADRARLSYALSGARDNPEMESFFGRFKTENRSLLLDAPDLNSLRRLVEERMRYFNEQRRHSTLGNRSPLRYLAEVRGLEIRR